MRAIPGVATIDPGTLGLLVGGRLWNVDAKGLVRGGDKLAALHQRIETLNSRMVDFKEGQYLSFTDDPAKGITVDVNGAGGAAIEGSDFANALLSIWIGREPPNEDLKAGLLGGKCK